MAVFHERLKGLREEGKLTFQDMAYLLDCSEQHYQEMEAGAADLLFSKAILLSEAFAVSLDYLAGNTDKTKRDA
ncbi:MAG: helix-turn-helix domain-containing protein [Acidaminococcales bacterium]|jgi:transcriptional regulator with XRE-family HTH domain|nr:helix-turn-helix domain-containing protein [Acidaminococcales bacterium]